MIMKIIMIITIIILIIVINNIDNNKTEKIKWNFLEIIKIYVTANKYLGELKKRYINVSVMICSQNCQKS